MVNFQQFDSGAVRDSQDGKIDFALITPTFKKDLAELLTVKAKHYGDRNWEKGIPTSRSFSSLLRHVEALGRGEWLDEESGHPHTVLAAANLMFIHEFHGTEFDTLSELIGPGLRKKWKDTDKAINSVMADMGALINYRDPEPSRFSSWKDQDGDVWSYENDEDGYKGWAFTGGGWDRSGRFMWEELDPSYFPMVRVS